MKNFFHSYAKRLELAAAVLTLALVLPVTVLLSQQQQDNRQEASSGQIIIDDSGLLPSDKTVIMGYVYVDQNNNGERDSEEKGHQNAVVVITRLMGSDVMTPPPASAQMPEPDITLTTDSYGFFKYAVGAETAHPKYGYKVTLTIPFGYKVTTKNPITLNNLPKKGKRVVHFGLTPSEVVVNPTPPQSCSAQTFQLGVSCGSDSFKSAKYTCQDGFVGSLGDATSCKPSATWKTLADQACSARTCANPKPSCTPIPPDCLKLARPNGPIIACAPPPNGWCPVTPTCTPRPACLDAVPSCLIPETPEMCPKATPIPNSVVCAQDAKQCSDGSFVGRTGPKCEFVCPR